METFLLGAVVGALVMFVVHKLHLVHKALEAAKK